MRKERRKKFFYPQTMLHWGVQCENRKKTPQHKSTYTINTWLATGGHIQLWQAAVRSGSIYYGAGRRPARQMAVQSVRRQLIGEGSNESASEFNDLIRSPADLNVTRFSLDAVIDWGGRGQLGMRFQSRTELCYKYPSASWWKCNRKCLNC